jgi:hypothetical protein
MPPHLRRLCHLWMVLAALISLPGYGKSPDKSARQSSPANVTARTASASASTNSLNPLAWTAGDNDRHPAQEPAWLIAALDDPEPSVRLRALETWAQHRGQRLDPRTHALVDPDEPVRSRAQELVEEALARK